MDWMQALDRTIIFIKSPIAWFLWSLIALSIGYSVYSARMARRAAARAAA